jgi:hypothetical protein
MFKVEELPGMLADQYPYAVLWIRIQLRWTPLLASWNRIRNFELRIQFRILTFYQRFKEFQKKVQYFIICNKFLPI